MLKILFLTFFISLSSFAKIEGSSCIQGMQYTNLAITTYYDLGMRDYTKPFARAVRNSCQLDVFQRLGAMGEASGMKYLRAIQVDNPYQAQAMRCLANKSINNNSIYEVALLVSNNCGVRSFCNLAALSKERLRYYNKAVMKCL